MFIGASDDLAAFYAFLRIHVKVGPADEDDGQLRLRFADDPEKRLVRFFKMLRRRRIVVIVHHKHLHRQGCDMPCHALLPLGIAGKAKVHLRRVQSAAQDSGVDGTSLAGAAALGDGGAIEDDGFFYFRFPAGLDLRPLREAQQQLGESVIQRKIERVMPHAAGQGDARALFFTAAVPVIHRGDEVLHLARAHVRLLKKLHAALAAGGKMRHVGGFFQLPGDGELVSVRRKAHAGAGQVIGQPPHALAALGKKSFRQPAEHAAPIGRHAADGKGWVKGLVKAHAPRDGLRQSEVGIDV